MSDPIEGLRHWRKVRELGQGLPDESVKEGCLLACRAIAAGGSWRLGMSESEMRSVVDEGRILARELGRPAAVAGLLAGVAAHHGVLGRAQAALEVAEECVGLADDTLDDSEIILVDVAFAYWSLVAGRIPDALATVDRMVERCNGDPQFGRELVGFSPLIWGQQVGAIALAQAGRFDECWSRLARAIRGAREHALQENLGFALGTLSVGAYFARGSSGAPVSDLRRATAEAVEVAAAAGSRYSQINASFTLAIASLLSGEHTVCEDLINECRTLGHKLGTGLDWHGEMLAVLADACLARGNSDGAITAAREGIEVSDAGGAWFQAALARAALVDALVQTGAPEHEITGVIAAARGLVNKSGGNSLLPRLREAEARLEGRSDQSTLHAGLRAAEAMYRAMGAPDPADRLIKELAS
jgi:tetratricopeptide (TPR) repeat protein